MEREDFFETGSIYNRSVKECLLMSSSNDYVRIARFLSRGRSMVWIRIINRKGSAPRDIGTNCLLLDSNTLVGSIGGGPMEFEALKMARRLFLKKGPQVMHYSLKGKDADASGMICGGSVDILMEPLHHTDRAVVSFFEAVKQHILSGVPGSYVSLVNTNEDDSPGTGARLFVGIDGKAFGSLSGKMPSPDELARIDSPRLLGCPETRRIFFVDPLERKPGLLIFGAGHISTCLAPMAKKMGFRIIIADDRAEYANSDRFPDADEIHVMQFELAVRRIQTSYNTYIAVATRGHIHDRIVLETMLHRPHAYLGMIGSVNKRDVIYNTLLKNGFSQEILSAVHAPIGLNIGAETPEEIAVSIIAEIIRFRAEKRNSWKSAPARNANVA